MSQIAYVHVFIPFSFEMSFRSSNLSVPRIIWSDLNWENGI